MPRAALAVIAGSCLLFAGCTGDEDPAAAPEPTVRAQRPPPEHPRAERKRRPKLERATGPAGLPGCRTASGRIIYVERVDPDGDGDAHFVLLSRQGVTSPGISVIDVKQSLRPSPLPGPGDRLSAAGPVETGSYGQSQIAAVVLHVAQ